MKTKLLKLNIIFLLLCGMSVQIFAQNDTVENNTDNAAKIDPLIKYFYKDKEEIKHLWKFDAVEWGFLRPSIAFESKLAKKLSWEAGWIVYRYYYGQYYNQPKLYLNNEIYLEMKYYYNYNNRLRRGKNINGFSGNYFSICLNSFTYFKKSPIGSYPFTQIYGDKSIDVVYEGRPLNAIYNEFNINYGIQRRIGRIGYVDAKVGCGIGEADESDVIIIHPRAKIRIGFGFKSLKFKKH